jgi:type IV secretion system protein VirB5
MRALRPLGSRLHLHLRRSVLAAAVLVGAATAQAQGIPVLDMANLMQAIVQVQAWEQQYAQMLQTIKQQEDFLKNATGSRGLGLIANAITTPVLPPEIQNTISLVKDFASLNTIAMQQYASINQAMQTRSGQIQQLMAQINTTLDAKSIQELTARIQAEQVMATNEAREGEWLRAQLETQSRILDQQRIQKQMDRLH